MNVWKRNTLYFIGGFVFSLVVVFIFSSLFYKSGVNKAVEIFNNGETLECVINNKIVDLDNSAYKLKTYGMDNVKTLVFINKNGGNVVLTEKDIISKCSVVKKPFEKINTLVLIVVVIIGLLLGLMIMRNEDNKQKTIWKID